MLTRIQIPNPKHNPSPYAQPLLNHQQHQAKPPQTQNSLPFRSRPVAPPRPAPKAYHSIPKPKSGSLPKRKRPWPAKYTKSLRLVGTDSKFIRPLSTGNHRTAHLHSDLHPPSPPFPKTYKSIPARVCPCEEKTYFRHRHRRRPAPTQRSRRKTARGGRNRALQAVE